MYRSLERIRAIAEAVALEVHDRLEITGVTAGRGHAEIVAVHRDPDAGAHVIVIGVDRGLTESAMREQISTQLRRGIRAGVLHG